MSNKCYKFGVIVGRFQIIHKGHGNIIREAMALCDHVGILIGSSQESGTFNNPFSFEQRKEFILEVFPDLDVNPLPDVWVEDSFNWGDYVLDQCAKVFGRTPDVFISGQESRRLSWFRDDDLNVFIPKKTDISSTKMKSFMLSDDRVFWDKYIEPAIAGRYSQMREIILAAVSNKETGSIESVNLSRQCIHKDSFMYR